MTRTVTRPLTTVLVSQSFNKAEGLALYIDPELLAKNTSPVYEDQQKNDLQYPVQVNSRASMYSKPGPTSDTK